MPDESDKASEEQRSGTRPISAEELVNRVKQQTNGHTNGHSNEPDESFFEAHTEAVEAKLQETEFDRTLPDVPPPYDLHAETAVISSIVISSESLEAVRGMLWPDSFYSEAHRRLFETCLELSEAGFPIDVVTILSRLRDRGRLEQVGGSAYVTSILNDAPAVINVRKYAEIVQRLAARRRLIDTCQRAAAELRVRSLEESGLAELLQIRITDAIAPVTSDETVGTVLDLWRKEGPLVHELTGLQTLDGLTDGGPIYGTRWVILGAPDAGKTALCVQLADLFARRDIAVGILAVDEEPGDLLARFAQRAGFSRAECERRDPSVLLSIGAVLGRFPLRFYDSRHTIESAAVALRRSFPGRKAALFVDSLQTVRSDAQNESMSMRELVTANCRAIKLVTTKHRPLMVVATSEMNRGAYRSEEAAETSNDMAAGKESGAIEYVARVMLALRSVKGDPDRIELTVTKNKHGQGGHSFYLQLDRKRMELSETDAPGEAEIPEPPKTDELKAKILADAALCVDVLLRKPGLPLRTLYGELRALKGSFAKDRTDTALARLQDGLVRLSGKYGATLLHLHGEKLPGDVLRLLPDSVRAEAYIARPPANDTERENSASDDSDDDSSN